MKYLIRLLALPFFLAIHTIFTITMLFKNAKDFLLYGGESIIHQASDRQTVHGMLEEIRARQTSQNE
jgi:hypothetical protein